MDQYDILNASWRNSLYRPETGEMRDCRRASAQGVEKKGWALGLRSKAGKPGTARWYRDKGPWNQARYPELEPQTHMVKGENQLLQILS